MDDYTQGQLDLIAKIKSDVLRVIDESDRNNLMFDVVYLLKNIKPIKK